MPRVVQSAMTCLLPGLLVLLCPAALAAQDLLVSADTAGHIHACHSCPGATGLGGLEKRASLAAKLRAEHGEDLLLLDAGNGFFGGESAASQGRVIAEAYAAIGYDALNLSYRDFRFGPDHTRKLLDETKLTGLSANLLDDQGKPIFPPMLIKESGGEKVAIIGLTEKPVGMEYLPHLKDQLAGITIADPIETLDKLLPEARQQADKVVVLFYGSPPAVSAVRERFAQQIDALLVGGTRPEELSSTSDPVTAASSKHGQHLTFVQLGEEAAPELVKITPDLPEDEKVKAIVTKHAPPAGVMEHHGEHDGEPAETKALPDDLRDLGDEPLPLMRASGDYGAGAGIRLEIKSARIADAWEDQPAGEGHKWLILDARIENDIPMGLAFGGEREAGEAVKVSLKQNLYLVGGKDGRIVYAGAEPKQKSERVIPRSFILARLDSVVDGELAFAIPNDLAGPLQVRLYHDEFDPAIVDLRAELTVDAELQAAVENEYAALAEPIVRFPEVIDGRPPPAGTRWVEIDLYGRSRFSFEGTVDADGGAKTGGLGGALGGAVDAEPPKQQAPQANGRAKPAVYLRAPTHLQLIADGQWARTREAGLGTIAAEPVFLPDRFTGGTAVFLAPADAQSLELVCYFPQLQGMTPPLKPETLRLQVQGDPPAEPQEQAMAVLEDDPLPLAVISASSQTSFGALEAKEGRALLALSCRIRNASDEDGIYEATGRFRIDGGQVLAVADSSGVALEEPMLLPAGERRAFVLIADVPQDFLGDQEVGYGGVSVNAALPVRIEAGADAIARADPSRQPAPEAPVDEMEPAPADSEARDTSQPGEDAAAEAESGWSWVQPGSLPAVKQPAGDSPLEAGASKALDITGQNRGVRLTVISAELADEFAQSKAREGEQFLVLKTRFENLQPPPEPTQRNADPQPPPYKLHLLEGLFLVVNGRMLAPHYSTAYEDAISGAIQVPTAEAIRQWEARKRENPQTAGPAPIALEGSVIYTVPRGALRKAELHLLDRVFGNVEMPLLTPAEPIEWRPIESHANRVVELGLFGCEITSNFLGYEAGSDSVWLVTDVRGRSLRKADPADESVIADLPIDHVPLRWEEGYCHLLLDGRYPIAPAANMHEFPRPLRFLPGAVVGGRIAFKLPRARLQEAQRVELVFDYHPTPMPGEALLRPEPARFVLKDGPELPQSADPLLVIDDIGVRISVAGMRRAPEAGRAADKGREWLVLDVDVEATMPTGEWFDPHDRLRLAPPDSDAPLVHDRRAGDSTHLPPPLRNQPWWIPSGQKRSMQLAWQVDAQAAPPPLRYTGLAYDASWSLEDCVALPAPMPQVEGVPVVDAARAPQGIESVGLTPEQVNTAIEKGRAWLWKELQAELGRGRKIGDDRYHLPMLLALVHTEAHKEFPEFDSALREYLAQVHPTQLGSSSTYKNGLLAMVIEGYGDPAFLPQLREVARYLIEDQGHEGSWNYNSLTPLHHFASAPRPAAAEQPEDQATGPLRIVGGEPPIERDAGEDEPEQGGASESMRRSQAWEANGDGDNSVSQFAVLGLWSCQRAGVEIDPEAWRRILRMTWHRQQSKDQGWGYHTGGSGSYGSMSCAGLSMAAIAARQLDPEFDLTGDPRIRGGLKWLAQNWEVGKNFNHGTGNEWAYYCTYGVERVGRILGIEFIGPHEWYPPLAKWLIAQQGADGGWPAGGDQSPRLSTTFALLFLVRATATLEETEDAQPVAREVPATGVLNLEAKPQDPGTLIIVLDASGSMLAELGGAQKFELARQAVLSLIQKLPDEASVGLVVYGHRLRATDAGADEDVEVLIPPQPIDKAAFRAALLALRPRGKTPLALSLDAAGKLLKGDKAQATVVLLTDGGQGREPGDPLLAARNIGERAALQIVGFDIGRVRQAEEWGQQLQAMAAASGGRYVAAEDAQALEVSLQRALSLTPQEFTLIDADGNLAAEGEFGQSITLAPGKYLLRTTIDGEPFEQELWIAAGRTTTVGLAAASR